MNEANYVNVHRTENFTLICWIITSVALMAKLKKRLWKTCRK